MKKIISVILSGLLCNFLLSTSVLAQEVDNHTAREEAEGKIVWQQLEAEEITCAELTDDEFGVLGEYYMGLMLGDTHESMNEMMISMMGEDGEEQMHVVMGKRLSGCDPTAATETSYGGWMSMMSSGMMTNNYSTNSMMNFGFMSGGWFFMVLFWVLIVVGIVALVKWLIQQGRDSVQTKTPVDILKERYAKGEINQKEFEEKKKDLV